VPDGVALTGFDNAPITRHTDRPPTSVWKPMPHVGAGTAPGRSLRTRRHAVPATEPVPWECT
jgi:DNA-binding LacI/PurR family transcriptional regulator